jgi:predicted DNA-binding transcriptional regulator AlpA
MDHEHESISPPNPHFLIDPLVDLREVVRGTGQCRTLIYRRIAQGTFPEALKLGRSRRWPLSEVAALNKATISGLGEAEVKALVSKLLARRKGA